ncbi:Pectinesterase inhibitor [Linum perenne]
MKHSYISILILIFITLLLTIFPHPNEALNNDKNNLIEKVCLRTQNKNECIASLASGTNSQVATLPELGIIAIEMASQDATKTSFHIKQLLSNQTLDPDVEQALQDCFQEYLDIVDQLDDTQDALLANSTKDVQTWVSAAMADTESCDQSLKEKQGLESMLSDRNVGFRQLCSTILAINNMFAETL